MKADQKQAGISLIQALKDFQDSWLAAKYGKLSEDWRADLTAGFAECFRVLQPEGVMVFKWNETQVKLREVLALTPHKPLFGQVSGRIGMTHWLVFMKPGGARG